MNVPYGWWVQHNLTHDWSARAWRAYALGALGSAIIIGTVSFVNNHRPDNVIPYAAERTVTVYGRVMDIHIQGEQEFPVCAGTRIKRRLVLFSGNAPRDTNSPEYVMDIPDDSVVVFKEGHLNTHLLVDLPVAPKPGTNWEYQPNPIDGCSWWAKFLPWYHSIKTNQGQSTPVMVDDKPADDFARNLPFIPRTITSAFPNDASPFTQTNP